MLAHRFSTPLFAVWSALAVPRETPSAPLQLPKPMCQGGEGLRGHVLLQTHAKRLRPSRLDAESLALLIVGARQIRHAEDVLVTGRTASLCDFNRLAVHSWAAKTIQTDIFQEAYQAQTFAKDDLDDFLLDASNNGPLLFERSADAPSWHAWAHSVHRAVELLNNSRAAPSTETLAVLREDAALTKETCNLTTYNVSGNVAHVAFGSAAGGAPNVPVLVVAAKAAVQRLADALIASGGPASLGKDQQDRADVTAWLARTLGLPVEPHLLQDLALKEREYLSSSEFLSLSAGGGLPHFATHDVTLVVHCRSSESICDERRPVIEGYRPFFRRIVWLVGSEASRLAARLDDTELCVGNDDPGGCVSKIMDADNTSSGMLYMHFDAVLSPCHLLQTMDVTSLSVFNKNKKFDYVRFSDLDQCNANLTCKWVYWDFNGRHAVRDGFLAAVDEIQRSLPEHDMSRFRSGIQKGVNDLFYVPRASFSTYALVAKIFARHGVFHEMAGPVTMDVAAELLSTDSEKEALSSFACDGGCCEFLNHQTITGPSFRCGHKANYGASGIIRAVATVQRQVCS